jgi:stringent starvation protein B
VATAPTSQRPYLLRALHEWMSDNGLTPQLVVDVSRPGVQVPADRAEDGRIILNISWTATGRLELGNEEIRFEARFGGVPHRVHVPVDAVIAIFARENGQGLAFAEEPPASTADDAVAATDVDKPPAGSGEPTDPQRPPPSRPSLKVVR